MLYYKNKSFIGKEMVIKNEKLTVSLSCTYRRCINIYPFTKADTLKCTRGLEPPPKRPPAAGLEFPTPRLPNRSGLLTTDPNLVPIAAKSKFKFLSANKLFLSKSFILGIVFKILSIPGNLHVGSLNLSTKPPHKASSQ